ncbi:MAG: response regulator transcription factor [Bdellovibrio sp.]
MFKILIIDDTKSVHAFVKVLLQKCPSIKTTSVFNGAEALESLKKDGSYDLIFLDWEMPILNGPDTLKKMKEMALNVPVVMMTTKNSPDDIQKMLLLGAAEYLMKPFTADIIFEKISLVTGKVFEYAA